MILKKQIQETLRCAADPWYFITTYCYTVDEISQEVRLFPQYDYLHEQVRRFQTGKNTIDVKSRQMLWTWLAAAFGLWEASFHTSTTEMYVSKREGDAKEIKRRANCIYERLPDWLRPKLTAYNELKMEFGEVGSRLIFMPSGPSIARTFTATRVWGDEVSHWQWDSEMYISIRPMAKTMNLGSTPYGPRGKFHELWYDPNLNFDKREIHYSLHPEKDAEWARNERLTEGYTPEQWAQEQECKFTTFEGLVYKSFSMATHVVDEVPLDLERWVFGIDWGYSNPAAVLLIGFDYDGRAYVVAEWYESRRLTPAIIEGALEIGFAFDALDAEVRADWAEPARMHEFADANFDIIGANKSVEPGIREVAGRLLLAGDGRPRLFISKCCTNTIREFQTHHYRKVRRDTEKKEAPAPTDNHALDALRYALMDRTDTVSVRWLD